jgi:hypothetical protein
MTLRRDRMPWFCAALLGAALGLASGCRIEPPPPLPPFDCATIDRAPERFPEECGDAGANDGGAPDAG